MDIKNLIIEYHSHHTKTITKATHFIGVPSIIFSLVILFRLLDLYVSMFIPFSWFIVLALISFYIYINFFLALGFIIFLLPLIFLSNVLIANYSVKFSIGISLFFFIFGWIFQLIGHYFEGNKPAFLTNILHAVIAPLFLLEEFYKLIGLKR